MIAPAPWLRRLVPLLGLLLAFSLSAAALHQHHDGALRDDHCAVCTVGHASAVSPAASVALPAPPRDLRRVEPAVFAVPGSLPATPARGRAPPRA